MTWTARRVALAVLVATSAVTLAAAPPGPEDTVRMFVRAMALHDTAAFQTLALPHPRSGRFFSGQPLSPDAKAEAERRLENLQVHPHGPMLLRGQIVKPDAHGDAAVGTVAHFIAASDGGPTLVTLVRREDGWRVDLRWWVAMIDLAEGGEPPLSGSPEGVARGLIAALVSLDRDGARKLVTPGAPLDVLFAGAPDQPEPSDQLGALAMEMPLVIVGPGEFFRLPSGRIVEGTASEDVKVIVGQFGPIDVPFVLHRVGTDWRAEAEPYYVFLNQ